jgi:ketosteroid isomerase-like protein
MPADASGSGGASHARGRRFETRRAHRISIRPVRAVRGPFVCIRLNRRYAAHPPPYARASCRRDTGRVMSEESTTPDLMELQRRVTDAANRRDLDAIMAFYAPHCVYDMSPTGMGVFEGQARARGFIADWWGAFDECEFEAQETLDLGNGVGFRVLIQRGRPVGSSGQVELHYAAVSAWEDGKIVRMANYNDIDAGRAAARRLAEERG